MKPQDELVLAKGFVEYVDNEFKDNDVLMLSMEQEFLLEAAAINFIRLIRENPQLPQ